jgi:hypothetical protein
MQKHICIKSIANVMYASFRLSSKIPARLNATPTMLINNPSWNPHFRNFIIPKTTITQIGKNGKQARATRRFCGIIVKDL